MTSEPPRAIDTGVSKLMFLKTLSSIYVRIYMKKYRKWGLNLEPGVQGSSTLAIRLSDSTPDAGSYRLLNVLVIDHGGTNPLMFRVTMTVGEIDLITIFVTDPGGTNSLQCQ